MLIYPIFWNFYISLHKYIVGDNPTFIGLTNYYDIFLGTLSKNFWYSVYITIILTILTVILQLAIGIGTALLIHDKTQSKIIRSVLLLPMIVAPVVNGVIWGYFIYHPSFGVLNYVLSLFGLEPHLWTYSAQEALPSVIAILVWQWTPFVILLFSSGLEALPKAPVEAAIVDGASSWQILFYIKLPLLKSLILSILVLRITDTLRAFDIIMATTLGGPGRATEILNIMAYKTAFVHLNMGVGCTLGTILFFISLISTILMLYVIKVE
jgi:multiple sugar transport system permease protein